MHNDFSGTGIKKSSRVGLRLTRDDIVLCGCGLFLLILLQQIGRCAVGLATAEDLATVQAMLLSLIHISPASRGAARATAEERMSDPAAARGLLPTWLDRESEKPKNAFPDSRTRCV